MQHFSIAKSKYGFLYSSFCAIFQLKILIIELIKVRDSYYLNSTCCSSGELFAWPWERWPMVLGARALCEFFFHGLVEVFNNLPYEKSMDKIVVKI
jgi:hypothetical protein